AVEFFRWLLGGKNRGKAAVRSVYADMGTYVHGDKTQGDDSSTLILKMEGGATAIAEESWAKPGGMDDRAEVYGRDGVAYADLLRGNAIHTYSQRGYGYAVEKAGATQGWSFTIYEEAWNYGFPQLTSPLSTGPGASRPAARARRPRGTATRSGPSWWDDGPRTARRGCTPRGAGP